MTVWLVTTNIISVLLAPLWVRLASKLTDWWQSRRRPSRRRERRDVPQRQALFRPRGRVSAVRTPTLRAAAPEIPPRGFQSATITRGALCWVTGQDRSTCTCESCQKEETQYVA